MDGDPVRIWLADGVRRMRRWHHCPADPHRQRWITVGTIEGGRRWFVESTGVISGTWAFDEEAGARHAVDVLKAQADPWIEVPIYDARCRPVNGRWERVGSQWRRPRTGSR